MRLFRVAAAGRDDLAALEKRVRHRDRLIEQAARIVAQIEDVALQLVLAHLRGNVGDRLLQSFRGLLVELADAHEADVVALDARAHRSHADDVARDRDLDRLVLALAHDGQLDLGVDRAAHLLDRLVQGEPLHLLAVELHDDVVRHDAGLGGGRLVDRGDDLHEAVFHRDLDAEPAELAARLDLHVAEAFRVHVARMRIEPVEHAVDCLLDELGVIRLLDVVGAHPLEHVAEQIELPVSVGGRRLGACAKEREAARLGGCERDGHTGRRANENEGSLAYHPRTFSLSEAHHGLGSTGDPSFLNSI